MFLLSIDAFYWLKCPECVFYTQEETNFQNHAVDNHPMSFVLFENEKVIKDSSAEHNQNYYETKQEDFGQNDSDDKEGN